MLVEAKSRPLPSDTGNGRVVAVPSNIGATVAVTGVKPALVLLSRPRSKDMVEITLVETVDNEAAALVVGKMLGEGGDAGVSALVIVEGVDTGVSAPALPANVSARPTTPLPLPRLLMSALSFPH